MSNIFTPTRTETRLDYFGNPYQAHVTGKVINYGKLWEQFKTRFNQPEKDITGQYGDINKDRVETYFNNDLQKTNEQ